MSDDKRGPRDERDSEPSTLAVGSPMDRLTTPIDDEGGEAATAVADARVLREMLEKAQDAAGRQDDKHNSDAPTQMRDRDDLLMSDVPTRPPPKMADDDNSDRTVATDSPDMLQESGSSPLLSDLEMARELMRRQMEAEASGQPAPPPAPSSDPLPQSARVSMSGDDIDPFEETIARPPPEAPSSDRAPRAPVSSQRGTSPLAGTGYVPAGAAPPPSPFAQTAYQHAPTQPVAFPVPGGPPPQGPAFPPPAAGQPPPMPPSQRMAPPMPHQGMPPQPPPHMMMQQPMHPQQMQLAQATGPGHNTNPGGPFGAPPPPIVQFQRPRAPQQTNRFQILVIIACGVIAAVGLVLILVALRR